MNARDRMLLEDRIFADASLGQGESIVLATMVRGADLQGGKLVYRQSSVRFAGMCGISTQSLMRHRKVLLERGLITRLARNREHKPKFQIDVAAVWKLGG